MENQKILNKKRKRDKNISENESNENEDNKNLKEFLSSINQIQNSSNYKLKGPFIYCAVRKKLQIFPNSSILYLINCYHTGIYECSKNTLIHYGEEDGKSNKKPLVSEFLNEDLLEEYQVIKYFYSEIKPEDFINLIDKNDWISERYDLLYHNCIHCTNEYLILNNIKPINYGIEKNIAYEYLCNDCFKNLGRYKMYEYNKDGYLNKMKAEYKIYVNENKKNGNNMVESEFSYYCEKCLNIVANWRYNNNWLEKSEEEEEFNINDIILPEDIQKEIKNFKIIGVSLSQALINFNLQNLQKYIYALVRKTLIVDRGEKDRNLGFFALVSLKENKIIEYGNEKYNNGAPTLRDIELEDKYLYHIVRTFELNKNIVSLFSSINLTPWTSNRYDVLFYSSYNFINIYLKKYNQEIILSKYYSSVKNDFLHLCRDCYKNLNHPDCFVDDKNPWTIFGKEKNEFWWCWNCGKEKATFHFTGESLNIKYDKLCKECYYDLAEPPNYTKIKDEADEINKNFGILGKILTPILEMSKPPCNKCLKNADYELKKPKN